MPEIIQNGTRDHVVLDCPYSLSPGERDGIVLKWYLNSKTVPIYQWIPPSHPQGLGSMRSKIGETCQPLSPLSLSFPLQTLTTRCPPTRTSATEPSTSGSRAWRCPESTPARSPRWTMRCQPAAPWSSILHPGLSVEKIINALEILNNITITRGD